MKPLIVNIRGNSGSGKTWLTREFMKVCQHPKPLNDGEDTLMEYRKKKWVVLGRYTNACGGCDTIKTQQEIIDRVETYSKKGYNVWLEGLIMSTIYGSVGAYSEKFGDRWLFVYLDTPLELSIARIKARRKEAGTTKPLNETNTRNRDETIKRNRQIVLEHKRRVMDVSCQNPLPSILATIWKEAI